MKKKVKKILKYSTGQEIPEGAVYLNTVVQSKERSEHNSVWYDCFLVWHYFLVEVEL